MNGTSHSASLSRLYGVAIVAVLAATALFMGVLGGQGRGLYMTSGVWAGLGIDFAEGLLYRPVHSEEGFGGTRYMPLYFVLHGAILSIINKPVLAAYLIGVPAAVGVVLGVYRLLRAFELDRLHAAAFGVFTMAAYTFQYGLLSTRGDMLAAALNVWGLALCALHISNARYRFLGPAALLFALAFMAKLTTLFGLAACVLFFAARGRWRDAIVLAGVAGSSIVLMVLWVHVASEGRALDSFIACAAGGTTFIGFLLSPFKFLYAARVDVPFLIFFGIGVWSMLARRRLFSDLPTLVFVLTTAATIIIAASPGTDLSHHIDLQAASVILAAVWAREAKTPKLVPWALPLTGIAGAAAITIMTVVALFGLGDSRWEQQRQIMGIVGDGESPLLADDPWVPILAGERPFVLNTFAVRTVSETRPEVRDDLFAKLDDRFFRAVVLYIPQHLRDAPESLNGTWRGKRWFGELFYPLGFEERLLGSYAPEAFIGEYVVLLPVG